MVGHTHARHRWWRVAPASMFEVREFWGRTVTGSRPITSHGRVRKAERWFPLAAFHRALREDSSNPDGACTLRACRLWCAATVLLAGPNKAQRHYRRDRADRALRSHRDRRRLRAESWPR